MPKIAYLLLIGLISSCLPFGPISALMGFPNWIMWVIILSMIPNINGIKSISVGIFTSLIHYFMWQLKYPQDNFIMLYFMLAFPAVFCASMCVEIFKVRINGYQEKKDA